MVADVALAVVAFGHAAVHGRTALAAEARPARRGEILDGRFCGHGQDSTGCGASLRRGGHRAGAANAPPGARRRSGLWGQKAAVRIHGIHGDGGVRVVRQDLGEPPSAHVVANQEIGLQDDAMPPARRCATRRRCWPQRRVHAQQPHLSVLLEMPFIAGAGVGVVQAAVLLQVLGRGRRAVAAQVVGRSADQQPLAPAAAPLATSPAMGRCARPRRSRLPPGPPRGRSGPGR